MSQRSLDETAQLSALIGVVYDAAIDSARWPDAIAEACRFLNCAAGVVGGADLLNHEANFAIQWGYRPDDWQNYLDNYYYKNPTIAEASRSKVGEIMTLASRANFVDLLSSEFYTEWAQPLGIVDAVQGTLDKTASSISFLTCVRHQDAGAAGAGEVRRMSLIIPHFRRAVLIGKLLDMRALQAETFAEAIDGLSTGVFLVNPQGEMVHTNASGQAMLDAEDPLKLVRGLLIASEIGVQAPLREAFASAMEGDGGVGTGSTALPISTEGGQFIAHVLPLTAGARRQAGKCHSAAAALFVRRAEIDVPAAINAAARLYGLTPAEERVLRALIEVGSIEPVAAMLGSSRATIRTHLAHLFEKTGTGRQAELVKLIAGFDSPMRSAQGFEQE
jgi:DNA-binding CsgD family transcriptional regulator